MKDLHGKAALLNALIARRKAVELEVRNIISTTALAKVQALKREHAQLVKRIARLESALK